MKMQRIVNTVPISCIIILHTWHVCVWFQLLNGRSKQVHLHNTIPQILLLRVFCLFILCFFFKFKNWLKLNEAPMHCKLQMFKNKVIHFLHISTRQVSMTTHLHVCCLHHIYCDNQMNVLRIVRIVVRIPVNKTKWSINS